MKSTRKAFLTAAASSTLLAAAPPSPGPVPSPAPTATAAKPPAISEAARALAAGMRRFDPQLSDTQLEHIGQGIDGNLKLGASINPHGRALKNWDEPVPAFEAAE